MGAFCKVQNIQSKCPLLGTQTKRHTGTQDRIEAGTDSDSAVDGLPPGDDDAGNGEGEVENLTSELTVVKLLQKEVFWLLFLNVIPTCFGHFEVVTDVFTLNKWHKELCVMIQVGPWGSLCSTEPGFWDGTLNFFHSSHPPYGRRWLRPHLLFHWHEPEQSSVGKGKEWVE